MAFGAQHQGSRVLEIISTESRDFKAAYAKYKKYSRAKHAAQCLTKEQQVVATKIITSIERGEDVF